MGSPQRIAINISGGFVPGLNALVIGTVYAADQLGWEVVGIRDGFDGMLFPERYPDGGLMKLTRKNVEYLASTNGAILGSGAHADPFHLRAIDTENAVIELDGSDKLLQTIAAQKIDGIISVCSMKALSIMFKLHRKGLKTVCIPKSTENDIAATQLSFGFNSALDFTVDLLDRARQAADAARKIGVVEVPGEHSGWLALQAGMAVCADAVLIPEIPYDPMKVAEELRLRLKGGRRSALVVVAQGSRPIVASHKEMIAADPMKASLSPGATGDSGPHVIDRTGHSAESVALWIQRLTDHQTYPLVLGSLVHGGLPTATDRQLGLGYGACAVLALRDGHAGVMTTYQPPDVKFIPLAESINKIRTVPIDGMLIQIARSIGISFGDKVLR